ncbi:MAG: PmeII family type II restriction endonuclease [Chloroflexaceae bacterium]
MVRKLRSIPKADRLVLRKVDILAAVEEIDADINARQRILDMEIDFRQRIDSFISSLPMNSAKLEKFNTSPFVLMFYCKQRGYQHISEIEKDILPAKLFSSMETSAGKMTEVVALPIYGWSAVSSGMHSRKSVLDGMKLDSNILRLATLKSGPRCLNDEMSKDIAVDIVSNCVEWAREASVDNIDFTYGVLYGTRRISNKKDWHILRNICEQIPGNDISIPAENNWYCAFSKSDTHVKVSVRIGIDWWNYLGNHQNTFIEICIALIRACVVATNVVDPDRQFTIADLESVVSTDIVPADYNVSLLQRSQYPWLFFLSKHFCDDIIDE